MQIPYHSVVYTALYYAHSSVLSFLQAAVATLPDPEMPAPMTELSEAIGSFATASPIDFVR